MDNTTKNKVIAAFMGVTWYDCWIECIRVQQTLYNEQVKETMSQQQKTQLYTQIEAQHQWCPEYHTTYDRLIPVMQKLRDDIKQAFDICEFFIDFTLKCQRLVWFSDRKGVFDHLYETIIHFNQLIKNKGDVTSQNTTQEV